MPPWPLGPIAFLNHHVFFLALRNSSLALFSFFASASHICFLSQGYGIELFGQATSAIACTLLKPTGIKAPSIRTSGPGRRFHLLSRYLVFCVRLDACVNLHECALYRRNKLLHLAGRAIVGEPRLVHIGILGAAENSTEPKP